jgi:hypothetical protein
MAIHISEGTLPINSSKSQSHAAKQEFFAQLDAKVAQAIGLEGL